MSVYKKSSLMVAAILLGFSLGGVWQKRRRGPG